ncbi:uncharacterized protein M421DRAFT_6042 [Didymella exigua CBS 183.55]|uniref:Uncharacterized protein n=1 Tax=Didymella exigua CBS 183.55 TaxID=1150837 RepID=A0A6A5RKI2_9PLEO|nr:uncharacterized protein M421DRAFT_6042 [Didymella exigua CBS 183.55]KAF1927790.1 hypothetical protein M421DRAFT_6042 [Didymella exigua CBS 183.55]
MSSAHKPMLYPKITQHVAQVVKALKKLEREGEALDEYYTSNPIPLVGYVKLHGTHADIVVYNDNRIILQSRNVSNITPTNDNSGFAAAMADKTEAILDVRDQYIERWKALNPSMVLEPQHPVIIAGQWIGTGIQKDVAVSRLSCRGKWALGKTE